ncbi:GvpL/GvpF family gas vesicle protein [Phytohabitans kaempferiae]|uniref:GvpL/GvpF family gas vesicle protein n=1 Tax=Phytohabitans kaempferiae TaxID=1620943 RepID=A0ABV6LYT4_9ACTN
MNGAAVYVFGVVAADHPASPADLVGLGGPDTPLWRVPASATAAVVAAAPGWLRARPRDLLAHQLVLDCLWQGGPVLPVRYGVVAPNEETLRAELRRWTVRHMEGLARVAGRMQLDVTVRPAALAGRVHDTLAPLAVRRSGARFLVEQDTVDTFRAAVAALDRALASEGRVRAIGPLPPYGFTEPIIGRPARLRAGGPLLDRSG